VAEERGRGGSRCVCAGVTDCASIAPRRVENRDIVINLVDLRVL
jgi:hypothetical protein